MHMGALEAYLRYLLQARATMCGCAPRGLLFPQALSSRSSFHSSRNARWRAPVRETTTRSQPRWHSGSKTTPCHTRRPLSIFAYVRVCTAVAHSDRRSRLLDTPHQLRWKLTNAIRTMLEYGRPAIASDKAPRAVRGTQPTNTRTQTILGFHPTCVGPVDQHQFV